LTATTPYPFSMSLVAGMDNTNPKQRIEKVVMQYGYKNLDPVAFKLKGIVWLVILADESDRNIRTRRKMREC
jgi:hypothetical protein